MESCVAEGAPISFGEAIVAAQLQCSRRGLDSTASFLGELAVSSASDCTLDSPFPSSCCNQLAAGNWKRPPRLEALFGTALGYFHRKEYRRCHFTLSETPAARNVEASLSDLPHFLAERFGRRLKRRISDEQQQHETGNDQPDLSRFRAVVSLCQVDAECAFLAAFALYMDGERTKHTESGGLTAPAVAAAMSARAAGPNVSMVKESLASALELFPSDAYIWWLYGVVSLKLARSLEGGAIERAFPCESGNDAPVSASTARVQGVRALTTAIRLQPLLWCAYQDLLPALDSALQLQEMYDQIAASAVSKDQPHTCESDDGQDEVSATHYALATATILPDLFFSSAHSSLHTPLTMEASLRNLNRLLPYFPTNAYILSQLGEAHTALENLYEAITPFSEMRRSHPFALEGTDTYSHVLYLVGDRLSLSVLAQESYSVNPVSAEANIVVGNYFASIRRRDQAILHFRRATAVNPLLTSAWTLLGHENIALKKTSAAADAYRAALIANPRDYRAWHALGKIYSMHHMHAFAVYYSQKAVEFRPYDPRLWHALADSFRPLERVQEQIQCLEQAELLEPRDSHRAYKTARLLVGLHKATNNVRKHVHYMQKMVASSHGEPEDLERMLPLLVRHYCILAQEYGRSASYSPTAAVDSLKTTQDHCVQQAMHFIHLFKKTLQSHEQSEGVNIASGDDASTPNAVRGEAVTPFHTGSGPNTRRLPSASPNVASSSTRHDESGGYQWGGGVSLFGRPSGAVNSHPEQDFALGAGGGEALLRQLEEAVSSVANSLARDRYPHYNQQTSSAPSSLRLPNHF